MNLHVPGPYYALDELWLLLQILRTGSQSFSESENNWEEGKRRLEVLITDSHFDWVFLSLATIRTYNFT